MGVTVEQVSRTLSVLVSDAMLFSPRPIDREDMRDGWPLADLVNDACQRRVLTCYLSVTFDLDG